MERLRDAAGDGRLDELDERIDAAYAARTYAQLEPLTHDLPEHGRALAPAAASSVPARVTGRQGKRWSLALMSGIDVRRRPRRKSVDSGASRPELGS